MRACLYCHGLLIATPDWIVACTLCGHPYPLSVLRVYTDVEWARLADDGQVTIGGEINRLVGHHIAIGGIR